MKIIVFTDIHGKIDLDQRLGEELKHADLVLLAGDVTHFGQYNEAHTVIDAIRDHCNRIMAIPGNCDNPSVEEYLENEGINLNGKMIRYNNIMFCGIGGSLPCPGVTPNELTEDEIEEILVSVGKNIVPDLPLVFVAHQPPINTINDSVSQNYHVGSTSIRHFIERYQPLICFTGHIHEGVGIDHIGLTKIVNPGPFCKGAYVSAQINNRLESLEIKTERMSYDHKLKRSQGLS